MTVTVHSSGKRIILSREGAPDLVHIVPRKNPYFKEELRLFREEIVTWLCGASCKDLIMYKPKRMSFYRGALYSAIVKATRHSGDLVCITTLCETQPTIR